MSVDPNIRKRMLEQGYAPDVIEWIAQDKQDKLRADFVKKNVILASHYVQKSFYEFIDEVFAGLDEYMVITGDSGFQKMNADELCDYQADKDNVYVVPASFINNYYSGDTCKDMYALVVDIDQIKPETLDIIINNGNLGNNIPMPTYITNSGSGVHFYYVFEKKVPYYPKNRKILADMYRVLCGITKHRIAAKTDWHSIVQPFRLPGSQTKLGQLATAFQSGDKWNVRELAKRLGVDAENLDLTERDLMPQEEYKRWKAKKIASGEIAKSKRLYKLQDGNKGFYRYCLERCRMDTMEGHRYMSMVGLSVVAYKVGIEKEQLEADLSGLLAHYNDIGTVITKKELQKAMRSYNSKALRCRSQTLEDWFGWDFKRNYQQKAKGRSRAEHLKMARFVRDEINGNKDTWRNKEGAPTKEQVIKKWREEHPAGTPKECMNDTGISKNTVYKWWDGVKKTVKTQNKSIEKESEKEGKKVDPREFVTTILEKLPPERWEDFLGMVEKMDEIQKTVSRKMTPEEAAEYEKMVAGSKQMTIDDFKI